MVRVRAPRLLIAGGAAAVLLAAGIGIAAASDKPATNKPAAAAAGTISCPTVADKLPAIPASAQAEVTRNLELLNTQIAEANNRLATSVGQGGPAFVQNAILGPLADKRRATIDRIAISIGRTAARPTGLESLATCTLVGAGAAQPPATGGNTGGNQPPATQPAAAAGTISCPTVADKLPAIPASAQAEVTRNLELLNTQIAEANNRLATSVGQGGPAFVQNAILGPLADKRRATIDRIAISIGRTAARPTGLESLATCTLVGAGAGQPPATEPATQPPATQPPAAAGTISCPTVADKLPAIPAAAQAEVDRNLELLNKQIAEANTRLANSVGQGGPAFVQNAILGPLADKRRATIDRIAISIGRHAARPTGLESLATCTLA